MRTYQDNRTSKLQREIDKYSNMPAHQIAPGQYELYCPTFQLDPRPLACDSNRASRYVAKGILSVHNLLDSEQMTRADDETEDLKEMIMEHLGCSEEEAAGFTVCGGEELMDPEDFSLDMDPPSVV